MHYLRAMIPALYLIPNLLGDTPVEQVLPPYNHEIIMGIRHFIVEDVRTARRFLKLVDRSIDIDQLTFYTLNKHTNPDEVASMLRPLEEGSPMGVISEAGCPAVADPGADVVAIAQRKGLQVIPLVGPSSIILAVMGSGFNGQSFAFNGYLPTLDPVPQRQNDGRHPESLPSPDPPLHSSRPNHQRRIHQNPHGEGVERQTSPT